jgi:hypothetical protein
MNVLEVFGIAILIYLAVAALAGAARKAVGSRARRALRDQAEADAWRPAPHGEPPRNTETSRWSRGQQHPPERDQPPAP